MTQLPQGPQNDPVGDQTEEEVNSEGADATMGDAIPRKSFSEGAPENTASEFDRTPLNQPRQLDADPYIRQYPDKKLMWINDIGGDVQRWIDAGADPVPVKTERSRTFEGITQDSQWVRAVGGENKDGTPFWVYLLMIDPEIYDRRVTEPERERQRAVHEAMFKGRDQSNGAGGELQSYAPNLPTGDRGMNVARDNEQ